jgi:hypothetical protein
MHRNDNVIAVQAGWQRIEQPKLELGAGPHSNYFIAIQRLRGVRELCRLQILCERLRARQVSPVNDKKIALYWKFDKNIAAC